MRTNDSTRPNWTLLVPALCLGVIGLRVMYWLDGALLNDDAFITFRYVANVASGAGFVYHHGEHVLGTTTPLWTLLLAGWQLLGVHPPIAARLMSIAADSVTCCLLVTLVPNSYWRTGLWAAVIWMVYPPAVAAALSGMETSLFVMLNVVVLWLIAHDNDNLWLRQAGPLAVLTRPEGILIFIISLINLLYNSKRRFACITSMFILPVIWGTFSLAYFGSIVPNSVIAKRHSDSGTTTSWSILRDVFRQKSILLLPFFVLGTWRSVATAAARPILIWTVLFIGAYALATPKMWVWYFLPMQLGVVVIASLGVALSERGISTMLRLSAQFSRFAHVAALVLLLMLAVYYYAPLRGIRSSAEGERFKILADYVSRHTEATDAVLAADIGYLGYYSQRTIYDVWGLVWPPALEYGRRPAARCLPIIEAWRPQAVVVPYWQEFTRILDSSVYFRAHYALDTAVLIGDQKFSAVWQDAAPDYWTTQYLVFLRR